MTDTGRRRLIRHLARGGAVVREDIGGVIGARCCGAARAGRDFEPDAFDRLLKHGCVFKGQARRLILAEGSTAVYRFAEAAP